MPPRINLLSIIFLMLFPGIGRMSAQPKCSIKHYSTIDGLSHHRVMTIIKDRDGFMWFGTWAGINRFDGHSFVTFKTRPGDDSPLKTNRIEEIVEDASGYLWIRCYDNRVYRFDKRLEKFEDLSMITAGKASGSLLIERMVPLKKGGMLLLKKDRGLLFMLPLGRQLNAVEFGTGKEPGFTPHDGAVTTIKEGNDGNIWVGTTKGLSVISTGPDGSLTEKQLPGANGYHVTACVIGDKNVFIGTANGSVLDVNNFKVVAARKLSAGSINAFLTSAEKGKYYCSTQTGDLISFKRDLSVISQGNFNRQPLLSLYEDSRRRIWIEPENSGVVLFQPDKQQFSYFSQVIYSSVYQTGSSYKVFQDVKQRVWINMKGGGFGYYEPETNRVRYFYNSPEKTDHYFSNMVMSQYYDKNGILWLATDNGGVEKVVFHINDFKAELIRPEVNQRPTNNVRGIKVDRKNRLWIGTKDGSLTLTANGIPVKNIFIDADQNSIGLVYSIMEDSKGNIWLGTKADGLYCATPTDKTHNQYRLTNYRHDANPNSISHNSVYSILEDKNGRIWVGTYGGGLNLLIPEKGNIRFAHPGNEFQNYPGQDFMRIRSLNLDRNGLLWIATTNGLLISDAPVNIAQNSSFKTYQKISGDIQSLGDNDVQFILKDSKEVMWLGTLAGGLNKAVGNEPLKSLRFRNFSIKDGLPSDYLLSAIEDKHHNLWIGTQNGLSKFNLETQKFSNLDANDGFPVVTFEESSVTEDQDEQVIFGTLKGTVSFYPATLHNSKINAKMTLTSLQVNSQVVIAGEQNSPVQTSIDQSTEIELPYDQDMFSISFAVLDYRSTGKEAYAYRLLGFDSDWRNNGNERRATFTKVPPGHYTFEVKSTAYDIYNNIPSHTLKITILPPPWKTWWAYLIYLVIAIGVLFVARRIVLTILGLRAGIVVERKLTELKLNFFTNVSHELRTPLTLIVNPLEDIAKSENFSPEGRRNLEIVQKNAGRMVRFVNQLLDLRKVHSGKATLKIREVNMNLFVERITTFFREELKRKGIGLEIHRSGNPPVLWIDPEKIEIVLYNLLSNAIKANRADHNMTISIEEVADELIISVADQGTGVPEAQLEAIFGLYFEGVQSSENAVKGTGIGLALSRELVALHQGKIYAENNSFGGLTVTVTLRKGLELLAGGNDLIQMYEQTDERSTTAGADAVLAQPEPALVKSFIAKVLLVEDNEELRSFLYYQLSKIYEVETAEDGLIGLEKATRLLPDLVISDVMMPNMDGIQMLDNLKNQPLTSHIPVILLSAKFSIESQIEGLSYGADFYMPKPFNNELLLISIDNLIRQRQRLFETLKNNKKLELEPSAISITSDDEEFLKRIIEIVEKHIQDSQFNIESIATKMNMGRSAFYAKFTSLTNTSPVEFVREIRLKRARQYFNAGKHNITEVAYEVGFTNQKYFSTCFRKQFGVTPTEYLKSSHTSTLQ